MTELVDPGEAYDDDLTIPDTEILYRRASPGSFEWHGDELRRVTSFAFQDQSKDKTRAAGYPAVAMSVHLATTLENHRISPATLLEGYDGYGLVSLTAGLARANNQGVQRDPLSDDPSHALVFALENVKKNSKQKNQLAMGAEIVIEPPNPP